MEELFLALAKDLPSTAILLLMLWLVNKQFTQVLDAVDRHLESVNKLLATCIDQNKKDSGKDD